MKLLIFLIVCTNSLSAKSLNYVGEARNSTNEIVYIEYHQLMFGQNNELVSAQTLYKDPSGRVLGLMDSNFQKNLKIPEHKFYDFRKQKFNGVVWSDKGPQMFYQNADQAPSKLTVEYGEQMVAGQGLNYWLMKNIGSFPKEAMKITFLFPGALDSADFRINPPSAEGDQLKFVVEIDSWWLRLFAPKLELVYEQKTGKLLSYQGPSNIKTDSNSLQNVSISYSYEGSKLSNFPGKDAFQFPQ